VILTLGGLAGSALGAGFFATNLVVEVLAPAINGQRLSRRQLTIGMW